MRLVRDKTPAQAAEEADQLLKDLLPEIQARSLTKTDLVILGQEYWEHTYKDLAPTLDIDMRAEQRLFDYLQNDLAETDRASAAIHMEMLKIPNNYISLMGAARWCDQAFPIVRLGHKRAAALMATSITEENLEVVRMPWPAFLIELPPDLLHVAGEDGEQLGIHAILVQHMGPQGNDMTSHRWNWITLTNSSLAQWQISENLQSMLGHVDQPNDWEGFGVGIDDDYDVRLTRLIGRLIAATCLMMSAPYSSMKQRTERFKVKGQKRPTPDAPSYRIFTAGKPVQVDARPAIRDYLAGKKPISKAPSVRTLVRGHFKPKLGQRLGHVVWVEPYWRGGNENSPIVRREHEA